MDISMTTKKDGTVFLAVAHEETGEVQFYNVDPDTGVMTAVGGTQRVLQPTLAG